MTLPVLHASPASAGPLGSDVDAGRNDQGLTLDVWVEGDVSQSKRVSRLRVPAVCWWVPWVEAGDPSDPVRVKEYWVSEILPNYRGGVEAANLLIRGPEDFDRAIAADLDRGTYPLGVSWYRLVLNEDVLGGLSVLERLERLGDAGCTTISDLVGPMTLRMSPVTYRWFPTRVPPEPSVDSRTLAEYAHEVMDLEGPSLEWNPRLGEGQASLVNLPTWLWVEDPSMVAGGRAGARTLGVKRLRASAGNVSVDLVARAEEVTVRSPAGGATCSLAQANQPYVAGVREREACTVTFTRWSYDHPGGFPVRASVVWDAVWSSSTGREGVLEPYAVSGETGIRVVQSQALVTDVG